MTGRPARPPEQPVLLDRRGALSLGCLCAAAAVAGCGAQDESTAPAPGTVIGSTDDVPVGGGVVLAEDRVVVTQPVAGQFRAFSAVCTHQGCTVERVAEGVITCPCHGSRFDTVDGSVVRGPAERPLTELDITVDGTTITAAQRSS